MPRKEVTVLLPIYIEWSKSLEQSLKAYIRSLILDSSIDKIEIINISRRFTKLLIEGSNAVTIAKFLERELGKPLTWRELEEKKEYKGRVIEVNDEAVYVDIGLVGDDYYKVKISFGIFLRKIFRVQAKVSREIFELFGIKKYFPVTVMIDFESPLDNEKRIVRGYLGNTIARMLRAWISKRFDRIIVYGATRSQVEKAIRESKHSIDVVNIERLGFLEHVIVCKWGTSAKGLIPEIGPYIPQAYLGVFMPRMIKKKIRESIIKESESSEMHGSR
ncbi:MAG: DUF2110 family protein [Candidatus Njordarchaeales archaeon]